MKRQNRAFSLIELLVVIAIIGLLIGILLPAIGRARASAHQARGLANLRQWVLAFTMYADDYRGRFPSEGQTEGGVVITDDNAWFNVLPPYANEEPLRRHPDVYGRYPRPGDRNMFMCPALRMTDLQTSPGATDAVFAYAYNLWIEHDGEQPLRWQDIENVASRFAVIGERGPTEDNPAMTRANMDERHLAFRHQRGRYTLIGFADGHAAPHNMETLDTVIWNPDN